MSGAAPGTAVGGASRPRPSAWRLWLLGARPRTLGAAAVPVAVGAAASGHASAWRTAAAAVVATGLQVGVNYANDYSDGVRGVDAARVGPLRLTASGLFPPRAVATAAALSLVLAGAAGLALAIAVNPWLVAVGLAAVLAALLYSGGPAPYAARALGEVAVFVFFGLVAVAGTAYVEIGRIPARAWWAAVPVGLLCVVLLVVNNLRDIPTDRAAGRRTLAVRIGDRATRVFVAVLVAAAAAVVVAGTFTGALPPTALMVLAAAPAAVPLLRTVRRATGRDLVPALLAAARLHLVFGVLLTAGLVVG